MGDIQALLGSPIAALVAALIMAGVALTPRIRRALSVTLFALAGLVALVGLWNEHIFLSITVTLGIYAVAIWAHPEAIPRSFGKLTPRRRLLFSSDTTPPAKLQIGDSGTSFTWAGPPGGSMFSFYDRSHLTVERIRGRVFVSTSVTDRSGNIIAEIRRNEWRAPPPLAWDMNYSRDALEVKNAQGEIVLQVVVLPDRIQLQGEWWANEIKGTRLVSRGPGKNGAIIVFGPGYRPENVDATGKIRPIFKYPSETNLGKRIT